MELTLLGTNHVTAPASVRDAVCMSADEISAFIGAHRAQLESVEELVILSTCHRTELYTWSRNIQAADRALRDAVSAFKGVDYLRNGEYTYDSTGREATRHLFRVATGLDSMAIGEDQILGQVKGALSLAEQNQAPGPLLTRLFNSAVHAGKRVRNETAIGRGAVSIASAAVGMATKVFDNLSNRGVLVLGAGETGTLVGHNFHKQHPASLLVMNRTFERARKLADELGGQARPIEELMRTLQDVDVVVTATASPDPIITAAALGAVMKERSGRPLVVIDIASPCDVEAQAGRLSNVFLYDLDALETILEQTRVQREKEIPKAEAIVDQELARFIEWRDTLAVMPVVRDLRRAFEEIGQTEIKKHANRFHRTDREVLERYTHALISKLLHKPTIGIKDLDHTTTEGFGKLAAVRDLFNLTSAPNPSSDGTTGSTPEQKES